MLLLFIYFLCSVFLSPLRCDFSNSKYAKNNFPKISHKNKLLIAGGAASLGTILYFLRYKYLKHRKRQEIRKRHELTNLAIENGEKRENLIKNGGIEPSLFDQVFKKPGGENIAEEQRYNKELIAAQKIYKAHEKNPEAAKKMLQEYVKGKKVFQEKYIHDQAEEEGIRPQSGAGGLNSSQISQQSDSYLPALQELRKTFDLLLESYRGRELDSALRGKIQAEVLAYILIARTDFSDARIAAAAIELKNINEINFASVSRRFSHDAPSCVVTIRKLEELLGLPKEDCWEKIWEEKRQGYALVESIINYMINVCEKTKAKITDLSDLKALFKWQEKNAGKGLKRKGHSMIDAFRSFLDDEQSVPDKAMKDHVEQSIASYLKHFASCIGDYRLNFSDDNLSKIEGILAGDEYTGFNWFNKVGKNEYTDKKKFIIDVLNYLFHMIKQLNAEIVPKEKASQLLNDLWSYADKEPSLFQIFEKNPKVLEVQEHESKEAKFITELNKLAKAAELQNERYWDDVRDHGKRSDIMQSGISIILDLELAGSRPTYEIKDNVRSKIARYLVLFAHYLKDERLNGLYNLTEIEEAYEASDLDSQYVKLKWDEVAERRYADKNAFIKGVLFYLFGMIHRLKSSVHAAQLLDHLWEYARHQFGADAVSDALKKADTFRSADWQVKI